jgi:hypothetical protein
VSEVELQLAGLKFSDSLISSVPIIDEMPSVQKRLVETVMTVMLRSMPLRPTASSRKGELRLAHGRVQSR